MKSLSILLVLPLFLVIVANEVSADKMTLQEKAKLMIDKQEQVNDCMNDFVRNTTVVEFREKALSIAFLCAYTGINITEAMGERSELDILLGR